MLYRERVAAFAVFLGNLPRREELNLLDGV